MKQNKAFLIFSIIAVVIIVVLSVAVIVLLVDKDKAPDYNPIEPDKNVTDIVDNDDGIKLTPTTNGGGAVAISYQKDVRISLTDGTASFYFANPKKSLETIVISLDIHGVEIAKSGAIAPGNALKVLEISPEKLALLSEGIYEAQFKLSFYDTESGELSIVSTDVNVNVTVVK